MGRPGKPAPEPMSITCGPGTTCQGPGRRSVGPHLGFRKQVRAAKMDSPKWRVTISSGWRTAVRLIRAFQCSNISIYIDIYLSWVGESDSNVTRAFARRLLTSALGPSVRKGVNSSAMRASSMRLLIVDAAGNPKTPTGSETEISYPYQFAVRQFPVLRSRVGESLFRWRPAGLHRASRRDGTGQRGLLDRATPESAWCWRRRD